MPHPLDRPHPVMARAAVPLSPPERRRGATAARPRPRPFEPPSTTAPAGLWVSHLSALGGSGRGQEAIALALDAVARELSPLAATFFRAGDDGEIASSVVHASHLAPAAVARQVRGWKAALHGLDPLAPHRIPAPAPRVVTLRDAGERALRDVALRDAYRRLGVVNDTRLLVRSGERVVAGVTLWRPLGSRPWTGPQLRLLHALAPLVELAYLAQLEGPAGIEEHLPSTLTRREREVARVLATGATNADLAR
ncbi:MAG TPA: hypothetical protein VLC53_05450, partial [Myxococcota bacterium]|nr:hypothetical protein [Myxococcota bacterium]